MPSPPITELLQDFRAGEGDAVDRLVEAVHGKLQAIAQREISSRYGRRAQALTIEPGVLADDALMKLLRQQPHFENRRHFFAYATRIMVRALVDYQRERSAQKRGGGLMRVTLSRVDGEAAEAVSIEELQPALEELEALDERKAEIVRLRVFWGLTVAELSQLLEISPSTVDREWRFSLRWLGNRLRSA